MADTHIDRESVAASTSTPGCCQPVRMGSFSLSYGAPPALLKGGKGSRADNGWDGTASFMGSGQNGPSQTLCQAFLKTLFVLPGLVLGTVLFGLLAADSNLEGQSWTCPDASGVDLAAALIIPAKVSAAPMPPLGDN